MAGSTLEAAEWQLISGDDVSPETSHDLALVQNGDFKELFESPTTRQTIGADILDASDPAVTKLREDLDYASFVEARITAQHSAIPADERPLWLLRLMCIGVGALRSFLQTNVTGPPLFYDPNKELIPVCLAEDADFVRALSKAAVTFMTVDGESPYHLASHMLLLTLAVSIMNSPLLAGEDAPQTASWWRLRVNFLHQRILSEKTGTLYKNIVADINDVVPRLAGQSNIVQAMLLVERAMVDTYFGNDARALKQLEDATELTGLKYVLTGVMGKRTQWQQKETSQLVVLAKSAEQNNVEGTKPKTLDLNDDTLLEKISFTDSKTLTPKEDSDLPAELASLDAGNQPPLHPLDATILLLFTETIKNTNPEDGTTREQMLPYAERVLSHSTNWEVYTLGLLVRSRIESTRSRTVERSVLQLQVVVDQVIAETTGKRTATEAESDDTTVAPTFLPQPKEGESASIRERLLYIHQLPIPTRWELEAELASRWSSVGGLRTALEIFERLEMWPEVALCWAATEQEEKAKGVIRKQLFEDDSEQERAPPPPQAPRLWCILGDIENNAAHYEKAWTVSNNRFARAKRSLGRYYMNINDCQKASEAYGDSLRIYPLHGPSWFALGCCRLELQTWDGAVRAFSRAVSIDNTDAEAWSNLATALLRRDPSDDDAPVEQSRIRLDDEEEEDAAVAAADPQRNRKDALQALKRAAQLKRESWRIWDNYLTVAATLQPPEFQDMIVAMKNLIALRSRSKGELAVDTSVLELLVQHIISEDLNQEKPIGYDPIKPGLAKQVVELVEKEVVPLITTDPRLWKIVARLNLWRKKPRSALEAHEKAWRAVNSRPGITDATEKEWNELVDATVELVDAYESLGQMERTDGLGAGELVAKDWRFKARSAVRGIIGKGKMNWEGTAGYGRLEEALEGLKA
ncbi:hypothetical protein BZA05DRAFT_389927 [Tricharina praecox]|uniref:uncharacterized protein n=1 Tax=Tricharina praecox TaxID=43433 RepID=UPI0022208CDE|nr:uncharacterized protein BZA05DRAFT_389927 [Tricharina praecox]KAI5855880.1 hypothetical protein BZA05DRAFT_389927 [Tricharina praecox]